MACVFHDINKYEQDPIILMVFLLTFKALYYSWPENILILFPSTFLQLELKN